MEIAQNLRLGAAALPQPTQSLKTAIEVLTAEMHSIHFHSLCVHSQTLTSFVIV